MSEVVKFIKGREYMFVNGEHYRMAKFLRRSSKGGAGLFELRDGVRFTAKLSRPRIVDGVHELADVYAIDGIANFTAIATKEG